MARQLSIAVNFKRRAASGRDIQKQHEVAARVIKYKSHPGEKDAVFDLSDLALKRPELVDDFCMFVRQSDKGQTASTRTKTVSYFRYFVAFLDVYEETFGVSVTRISEITSAITLGYADWLDGNRHIESKLKLAPLTKNTRYNAVKRFIKHCQKAQFARDRAPRNLAFRVPWKFRPLPANSRKSLSLLNIKALRKVCKEHVATTTSTLRRSAKIKREARITVPDLHSTKSVVPFHDPDVRLKASAQAFDVNRLTGDFRSSMKGLARALRAPYGDVGAVIKELHFTTDTLLPFIVLIGLATCFNEIGLLTLTCANVKRGLGVLGDERIFVIGIKARAGRHQRRSFPIDDDPFSVSALIETVITYTAPLRQHVDQRYADTLFIAARTTGDSPAGFFDGKQSVYGILNNALKALLRKHCIPDFNLNDLRTIGGDVASMMSEGDLKVQQIILQHASMGTTQAHYETHRAAKTRQEQLVHLMNERERFIASGGRIDPRNAGASTGLYRAASPGLDCLDAMNSPIPGQRDGTLCSAYGKCFTCRRAVFFPSVVNAARLLQFDEQFALARSAMSRSRWTVEWEPEHLMLREFWLLLVPEQVLFDAQDLELPPRRAAQHGDARPSAGAGHCRRNPLSRTFRCGCWRTCRPQGDCGGAARYLAADSRRPARKR
ncbi:hypothetical protein [Rhizobium bangladeshense]|uniref:hypothetical protein n=1 Tax=Rhizobium bangladeshense TaxID=1138189 RepID=UPI001C90073C|nr:hypothetical protein [Rhizobium bangladeshense]MBY3613518.1 hypothetical protein [Rhizobium bangladeshense]